MKKLWKNHIRPFLTSTQGIVINEYLMIALVVILAAGPIVVGLWTHYNTGAKNVTTKIDSTFQ